MLFTKEESFRKAHFKYGTSTNVSRSPKTEKDWKSKTEVPGEGSFRKGLL